MIRAIIILQYRLFAKQWCMHDWLKWRVVGNQACQFISLHGFTESHALAVSRFRTLILHIYCLRSQSWATFFYLHGYMQIIYLCTFTNTELNHINLLNLNIVYRLHCNKFCWLRANRGAELIIWFTIPDSPENRESSQVVVMPTLSSQLCVTMTTWWLQLSCMPLTLYVHSFAVFYLAVFHAVRRGFLLCIYPYSSGLFDKHSVNLMISSTQVKWLWRIWKTRPYLVRQMCVTMTTWWLQLSCMPLTLYVHSFAVFILLYFMQFAVDSCYVFTHILRGYLTNTRSILWFPQNKWSDFEGYEKLDHTWFGRCA